MPAKEKAPTPGVRRRRVFTQKYELTDDEIQLLVEQAQQNDTVALSELFKIFGNFLDKYIILLYDGRFSYQDYDIRRFLALFVKDPTVRYPLIRNRLKPHQIKHVNDIFRGIHFMVKRYASQEDVEQTVHLTFLQCVMIYKRKDDVPFSSYIYSYFFYVLKKSVESHLIDQLGRKTFPLIVGDAANELDSDSGKQKSPGMMLDEQQTASSPEDIFNWSDIDNEWIAGHTARFPFDTLTVQERQLIKWKWIDKLKASNIAERLTEHPNTVREQFNIIKFKLRNAVDAFEKDFGD